MHKKIIVTKLREVGDKIHKYISLTSSFNKSSFGETILIGNILPSFINDTACGYWKTRIWQFSDETIVNATRAFHSLKSGMKTGILENSHCSTKDSSQSILYSIAPGVDCRRKSCDMKKKNSFLLQLYKVLYKVLAGSV